MLEEKKRLNAPQLAPRRILKKRLWLGILSQLTFLDQRGLNNSGAPRTLIWAGKVHLCLGQEDEHGNSQILDHAAALGIYFHKLYCGALYYQF